MPADRVGPDAALLTRLRELIREAEQRHAPGAGRPHMVRETYRLDDGQFADEVVTPFGSLPVIALDLPSSDSPVAIPPPLIRAWGITDEPVASLVAMDIETAATVGGESSCPFVIGLALQRDGALRLEQLMLRSADDESAALWVLDQRLGDATHLITYNGSRFDLPLLDGRSRALGHGPFTPPCIVIDLEPCARSIFGHEGRSSRLPALENRVLATVRPAWTWHPIWSESVGLSWRRRRHLARILAKNSHDALSLLPLFRVVCDRAMESSDDPAMALYLGAALEKTDPGEALRWYLRAAAGPLDERGIRATLAAWRLGGSCLVSVRRMLAEAARSGLPGAWRAAEQLGLAAWRERDMPAAVRWTESALSQCQSKAARDRLFRRVRRLTGRTGGG